MIDPTEDERSDVSRRSYLKTVGIGIAGLTAGIGSAKAKHPSAEVPVPGGRTAPSSKIVSHSAAGLGRPDSAGTDPSTGRPSVGEGLNATGTAPQKHRPDFRGWAASTKYDLPDGSEFSEVQAYYDCPSEPPTYDSDLVHFVFPAILNDAEPYTILQPVLAWNWWNTTGWKIAAWWGPDSDGNYHHSQLLDVSPGDEINGWISKSGSGTASDWWIGVANEDTGQYTDLTTDVLDRGEFREARTALEIKDLPNGQCSKLPGDVVFRDMYWKDTNGNERTFSWTKLVSDIGCPLTVYTGGSSDTFIDVD